jgi:ribonuclease BN (tRNA processing enzyme)
MKLTLLGTSDFRLDAPLASAGSIVEAGDTLLKLDFGRGNLVNLAHAGYDWRQLDAILLTHIHPDHIGDLFQYLQLFTVSNAFGEADNEITIYGPHGFEDYFPHLRQVIISIWDKLPTIKEVYDEQFTVGGVTVRTLPMKHTIDNAGYRLEADGKVLCYTGDTEPNANLVDLARDADLLLTECFGLDQPQPLDGHLRPQDIADLANRANVKKVVLTHYPANPDTRVQMRDQVRKRYTGEVVCGEDLMEIEI